MNTDYQDILARNDKLKWVLPEIHWKAMQKINETTCTALDEMHLSQMRENIRNGMWAKHGAMRNGLWGIGTNKAVIGIGAGGSLARNKDVLVGLFQMNLEKHLDDQPFMLAVCNHSFRPLLRDGVYPHFVCLIDASTAVMKQLNSNIPHRARNTILLTGLHVNPGVIKEWDRQGRPIQFYVGASDRCLEVFKEETGEDGRPYACEEGGNVLNTVWLWAMKFLKSTVFMTVGNDLSYPLLPDLSKRRKAYYADGDYSSNIGSKRDEAKYNFGCMGFDYEWNGIIDKWVVNLSPKGTAWQLWTYKRWLETQITMHEHDKKSWHFFNCSESGILGVVPKDDSTRELMMERSNYVLLDEVLPKRWHTMRLEDAAIKFIAAREVLCQRNPKGILTGAGLVDVRPEQMGIVRTTGHSSGLDVKHL